MPHLDEGVSGELAERQEKENETFFSQANLVMLCGPELASSVAPWCKYDGILAWTATCRHLHEQLSLDSVWRDLLLHHFQPIFALIAQVSQDGDRCETESPTDLLRRFAAGGAKSLYRRLCRITPRPFVLDNRNRLMLEIHELREWDQLQRSFLMKRQARQLADTLELVDVTVKMYEGMQNDALHLFSLMTMLSGDNVPQLEDLHDVAFGQEAEQQLKDIQQRRIQERRKWWQRQREFLLQDLNWH
eukprot:TRINITY_DN103710_c0_g1_i1.p1 TRINITY_DN103710_c0_g1~~TRINITY_DN103710_c0_g1_i1.p1  ORF type:complete len:246 (+),score=50.33 TRINITY_DN103710_c0_g1_i1:154-891(+)